MGEQTVSHLVPRTVSTRLLRHARRYDRIEPVFDETGYHGADACGIVGCVAVNQDIKVSIDVGEHSPYYFSLPLTHFAPHQCPSSTGNFDRAIGRIVVVNVDRSLGQHRAEIGDHLGNGRLLVEAGYQDCHALLERAAQSVRTSPHDLALRHRLDLAEYQPRLCTSPHCDSDSGERVLSGVT